MKHDHYSGNFWWARGDHIADLQKCPDDQSGWGQPAEFWVMNPPKSRSHVCLYTTNMNNMPPCGGLYGNDSDHYNRLDVFVNV
jgi:hypothetical protein